MLSEHDQKGSSTATRLLNAHALFKKAVTLIESGIRDANDLLPLMSEAYQIESLMCQLPRHLYDKVIAIIEDTLNANKASASDLDIHARVCYMFLKRNIAFITASLNKYPNTKCMLQLRGHLLYFEKKYKEALDDFQAILSKSPADVETLYLKSAVLLQMREQKQPYEAIVACFEKFLTLAPKDHPKVPEAYYSMAHLKNVANCNSDMLGQYRRGLESEKSQLPCFLPYQSNLRDKLKLMIEPLSQKERHSPKEGFKITTRESLVKDHRRISLIVDHRGYFNELKKIREVGTYTVPLTFAAGKKQTLDSLNGKKQVYIKDIDFTKDHVLKGYVIKLKAIELPIVPPESALAVRIMAEDEFGFAERISIYNLRRDKSNRIEESYKLGRIFSIVNPYIRMARDGKPMIRVDDPKSVIFFDDIQRDICRFCLKGNSKYNCSKCKIAQYCCKECQIDDWKVFKHKLVCI